MAEAKDHRVVLATIAYALHRGRVVYVGGRAQSPSDPDWGQYMRFLSTHYKTGPTPPAIVHERGFGPTLRQRQLLQAVLRHRDVRVSVLTDSVFARGLVRLMSMVSPGFKAYSPEDLSRAFSHVGISGEEHAEFESILRDLAGALDGAHVGSPLL